MKVTVKDVEHIAGLSRLTIPESEMEKFSSIMPTFWKRLIRKALSRPRMYCRSATRSARTCRSPA